MDLLGQRTHCGPNVAAPNPRQPYLGDFTANGLDQLTLCSQSPGFGTPAAPVQPHSTDERRKTYKEVREQPGEP
ncbi:hypothetical protein STEG23_028730 [Scotinomys teguina]